MAEIPKQIWAHIARLLPQQKSQGSGATQVGKVGGDVTVVHLTQNVHAPVPAPQIAVEPTPEPTVTVSAVLHQLTLLEAFGKRHVVLSFAQSQFGTSLLKNLSEPQLRRTHAYARGVLQRCQQLAQAAAAAEAMHSSTRQRTLSEATRRGTPTERGSP